jgi:hypothetical protein
VPFQNSTLRRYVSSSAMSYPLARQHNLADTF